MKRGIFFNCTQLHQYELFSTEISANRVRGGELSELESAYCLGQLDAGATTREVADTLGCTQRCVQKTVQRWKETSSTISRPRVGRPHKLTSRDHRRLLRIAQKYPHIEYRKLMEEAGLWDANTTHPKVSKRTVQCAMDKEGYHKFRSRRRPKTNKDTARQRLDLADEWTGVGFGRYTIRFSDECSVARGSGHHTPWVWRLPEDKWSHNMIEEVTTARQPARMVWASIWMTPGGRVRRSRLVIVNRATSAKRNGYTAHSYVQALEERLRDSYRPNEWFMQDNAPIHTAQVSKEWLEVHGVATIRWPPYSPDLNPIEHLWWALKKKLHELHPEFDNMGDSQAE